MRSAALLICVALAGAVVQTSSAAERRIVDSGPVSEAPVRAVTFWQGAPCSGEVTIVAASASEAPSSGANNGELATRGKTQPAAMWATWSTPSGVNQFDVPGTSPPQMIKPAQFTDCVVHASLSVWPDWLSDDARFKAFCKEVVHEYGHFEGHPDAGALRGTVEYEQPVLARVAPCERSALRR